MNNVGHIKVVWGNMVTARFHGAAVLNSAVYCKRLDGRELLGEIVRIRGDEIDFQVYEETRGLRVGDEVSLTGELIHVSLGPGLLSSIYDGLQNPLSQLASKYGVHVRAGTYLPGISTENLWEFSPSTQVGAKLHGGLPVGTVKEGIISHKIMVPFNIQDDLTLTWVADAGTYKASETVAILSADDGTEIPVTMVQKWPIKIPLVRARERIRPTTPLNTKVRIIDTLFPIAKGGTYCIPGPFGAGKTVLQQIISRFAEIDVVIIAACGERAGEVVETIKEFPEIIDPKTGDSLMKRTVIICNTSSMPVAAREASVYTAVTIGEYYRQMGLDVLLLADSTSRWAQALREMSGRLEEIPGEEAFPSYLESRIANFYERSGSLVLEDGGTGSLTIGGTVSPAGGNFEEPVTQGTLKVVGAFLGLSSKRADARRFPSIDPLDSWSTYTGFIPREKRDIALSLLKRGDDIKQMMAVVGEEGTSIEDYTLTLKSDFLDTVYLQQNAYDDIDANSSLERQTMVFNLAIRLIEHDFEFASKKEARVAMVKAISLFRNWNYTPFGTALFNEGKLAIEEFIATSRSPS